MPYNPICKSNQLIIGEGDIAIVTGWTPRQKVAKLLSPADYAVIGNLYSPTRGISFLVRNLLANPQITKLALLNATKEDKNAGSILALLDFFTHGVTEKNGQWVINSDKHGVIDGDIPLFALELLRKRMEVRHLFNLREFRGLLLLYSDAIVGRYRPQDKPLYYPEPDRSISSLQRPGHRYGHRIEASTIAQAWVKILHRIRATGTIRPTGYDGQWQELIDLVAVVTDEPPDFYFPDPNYLPIDKDFIYSYLPQILEDAPYQEGVKYTYGQRLRSWFGNDQIEKVIDKLVGEIDSASAVMSLWDAGGDRIGREPGDSDHDHGGSPCLNHIWVRVVDGELSLTATFRSNDMYGAWPSNAMGLRALQWHIKAEIEDRSSYQLSMGPLITISQSAHIYDDCWESVDGLIDREYKRITDKQMIDFSDPVGNFVVSTENEVILIEQNNTEGKCIANYKGTNPLKLIRSIVADNPGIRPEHIGYLGAEIQKCAAMLR